MLSEHVLWGFFLNGMPSEGSDQDIHPVACNSFLTSSKYKTQWKIKNALMERKEETQLSEELFFSSIQDHLLTRKQITPSWGNLCLDDGIKCTAVQFC